MFTKQNRLRQEPIVSAQSLIEIDRQVRVKFEDEWWDVRVDVPDLLILYKARFLLRFSNELPCDQWLPSIDIGDSYFDLAVSFLVGIRILSESGDYQ